MNAVMSTHMRQIIQKVLDEYHDERPVGSLVASHIGGVITIPGAEPIDEGILLEIHHVLRIDNTVGVSLTIRPFDAMDGVSIHCEADAECVLSAKGVVLS